MRGIIEVQRVFNLLPDNFFFVVSGHDEGYGGQKVFVNKVFLFKKYVYQKQQKPVTNVGVKKQKGRYPKQGLHCVTDEDKYLTPTLSSEAGEGVLSPA